MAIILKKIAVSMFTKLQESKIKHLDCYLIVQAQKSQYFCKTAKPSDGRWVWILDKESVRVACRHRETTFKLKIIDYGQCKSIGEHEVLLSGVSLSSKGSIFKHIYSKDSIQTSVQIQYCYQQWPEDLHIQNIDSYANVSKKTITTNHQETTHSLLQKVASMNHIPSKEKYHYHNAVSYLSPRKDGQLAYLRAYRDRDERKLFESIHSPRKVNSKLII